MIRSSELDRGLIKEIMAVPGGENLLHCWSCGTCAATCLVRRYDPTFNPRLILRKAGMGMRHEVLSSREIWLCSACDACYPRCPQEIHISDVMKAIRVIALQEGYAPPGPFAEVNETICSGCAVCTRACPYGAIERGPVVVDGEERMVARVDSTLCQRCGVCVAACPSGSISLEDTHNDELLARMGAGGWLEHVSDRASSDTEPRILAFVCQWSMRSEAEWAAVDDMQSDHLRIVNLPCSGRVDPALILLALSMGVDGVLVAGCAEGECHYKRGTYLGRSKVALLDTVLGQMSIPPERVRFVELGALNRGALPTAIAALAEALRTAAAVSG